MSVYKMRDEMIKLLTGNTESVKSLVNFILLFRY